MYENSHNVISRLTWDTTFDNKEQALTLQGRLSDWSGFLMEQEMAAIFNKLCPPEQTWKIQLLELDLGIINFNTLESELPVKLRQQLNEKLTELILYSHQRGRHIEILDEKRSHVQIIRYFLWNGILPWNYQTADGSVNQILTAQLQNNREELIAMLKESGFSSEQVRQRIAWQFNEPNMIKIIEGIEPNVGGQIILFSNELTKIQQKETVVQATSTIDFKKNLWLWVLNYLFTERGTVFNRIQFMKSSIVQMAAHYNMQYEQLFERIELSVASLSRSLSLQPDFIITLQLLSKENKRRQRKSGQPAEEDKNHWYALEILFRDQKRRKSAGNNAVLNELVQVLSIQDKERFRILINSFGNTTDFWLPLIGDLSDDTLKTLFISLKGSQSIALTTCILFLNRLNGGRLKPNAERDLIWYRGLMFLIDHKNTSFDQGEFLQVLITALAQKKQQSVLTILDRLMAIEVPTSLKTILHAEIYRAMTTIFRSEISRMSALAVKKHIQQFMQMFHQQVNSPVKNQKHFKILVNILENYVQIHPKAVKEVFMTVPHLTTGLESILFPFITGNIVSDSNLAFKMPWADFKTTSVGAEDFSEEIKKMIQEGMNHHPEQFLEFVKEEIVAAPQLLWLNKLISFTELIKTISQLNKPRQSTLDGILQFHKALATLAFSGITGSEMQYVLFEKVIRAWTSGNWKLLSAENIWKELIWEVCTKRAASKTDFLNRMDHGRLLFPLALQVSLETLIQKDHSSAKPGAVTIQATKFPKPLILDIKEEKELLKGGISIRNAGLVLINSYLAVLLTRLGVINEHKKFLSTENQLAAVHYLQYVVTGLEATEESFLPLNKLLCGIPLSQPVMDSLTISWEHKKLIEGLIEAVIGHWPEIGNCSVNGFRGNWLVRDGLLTEREDKWELTVEKRAYDLLIHKSPFSFSVIRHPWMEKPLHVNWPY